MSAQQLALQCPLRHAPFRRTTWKGSHHFHTLPTAPQTVVSCSGAEVAKRRAGPAPTRHVIQNVSDSHKPLPPREDASNKFLEVYILGKHIGSGAYGQVQLVVERATGQCAAVKLLPKTRGKLSKVWMTAK